MDLSSGAPAISRRPGTFARALRTARRHGDVSALALLGGLISAVAATRIQAGAPPFEDAAMLMRYSDHLAHGHGIVWNVGAHPVDGATDFLFMVAVAGVAKLGVTLEVAVRMIDIAAHVLSVAIVYAVARKLHRAHPLVAFAAAAFLAVGPALSYTAASFGTPFFGLFVASSSALAYLCRARAASTLTACAFAASCLFMGLARPEGVMLAVFMLIALVFAIGIRRSLTVVASFITVFGALGFVYFVWRWHYFGHPLPNPYYKKGSGHLYVGGLQLSIGAVVRMLLPLLGIYALALAVRPARREAAFSLLPIGLFTAMWILLSGETNFDGRFQYPTLVLAAVAWPGVLRALDEDWQRDAPETPRTRLFRPTVAIGLVIVCLWYPLAALAGQHIPVQNGNLAAGRVLQRYAAAGYRLATTEAGLVPLYSRWTTMDAWGLNDSWIAHHGRVTERYLASFRPDVVMMHAYFSPQSRTPARNSRWTEMTLTLRSYVESHDYVLAAAFGSSRNTDSFYVRCGMRDADEIVRGLRSLKYVAYDFGRAMPNLAPSRSCGAR